jgi:hypothetical protein
MPVRRARLSGRDATLESAMQRCPAAQFSARLIRIPQSRRLERAGRFRSQSAADTKDVMGCARESRPARGALQLATRACKCPMFGLPRSRMRSGMTDGCARARARMRLEPRDELKRGGSFHAFNSTARSGALSRTMICERSGPTDTYATGTPTAASMKST